MESNKLAICTAFVFVFIFGQSYAANIKIKDCGSKSGKINAVSISGCSESDRMCILKRNTNVTITIAFEAEADADELMVVVHGLVMDIPTPFPMPQPNACQDSGVECPIEKGNSYEYTTSMPILKSYPKIAVEIKFELKSSQDFVCVLIPAKIN